MIGEKGFKGKTYIFSRFFLVGISWALILISFINIYSPNEVIKVYSSLKRCQCSRKIEKSSISVPKTVSVCDNYATLRPNGQKVVAYSYFGQSSQIRVFTHYLSQIAERSEEIRKFYPNWIMRIYFHLNDDDILAQDKLCEFWCRNDHIDLCNVEALPILGNFTNLQPFGKLNLCTEYPTHYQK